MNPLITEQLLLPFMRNFFLVFGVVGFSLGVALIFHPSGVARLFGVANRWVSMRRSSKWLEIPRPSEPFFQRYRFPIGVVIVVLATFSLLVLATKVDAGRVAAEIHVKAPPLFVVWLVESVLRFLMLGNLAAIVIGIMLAFFPGPLSALEARANRWYSTRQYGRRFEASFRPLDRLTESNPRAVGWAVSVAALVMVVEFAMLQLPHS